MRGDWPLARQTPGGSMSWGECRYFVNPAEGTFDACAVYEGIPITASILCPPDRTLFITGEPPSIKQYDERFLAQFHDVRTCHTDMPHPRRIHDQQGLFWYAGIARPTGARMIATFGYDEFRAEDVPEK